MEEILRQRLRQHPTPLDTDALWAEVEERLPQKQRRILPPWVWILTGSLVLLGGLFLLLNQPKEEEPQTVVTAPKVITDIAPPTSSAPASAPATTQEMVNPTGATSVSPAGPPSAVQKVRIIAGAGLPAARAVKPPASTVQSLVPELPTGAAKAVRFLPLIRNVTNVVSRSERSTPSFPEIVVPAAPQTESGVVKPEMPPPPLPPEAGYAKAAGKKAEHPAATLSGQAERDPTTGKETQAREDIRRAASETPRWERETSVDRGEHEKKPEKIRKKQPAYWTVEPGFAISRPLRSVSVVGENPDENQAAINRQHETPLEGITLRALVGYHRAGGLSIRTGFALSRINSKVASTFTTVGTESVEAVVAIIESPNGSRREQTGTVEVTTETTLAEKHYNHVRSIDVPLLLGYRFGGTKWGLTVEAGPTFNISSGGRAHLYDGAGVHRLVDNEQHFRSKLTELGFLANFGGAYRVSKKTMLTANLRLQGFGRGGFEAPSTGYATKYSLIGIQLGYRIRF